jgi:hypothetical protein
MDGVDAARVFGGGGGDWSTKSPSVASAGVPDGDRDGLNGDPAAAMDFLGGCGLLGAVGMSATCKSVLGCGLLGAVGTSMTYRLGSTGKSKSKSAPDSAGPRDNRVDVASTGAVEEERNRRASWRSL